jgi:hypothetical protein
MYSLAYSGGAEILYINAGAYGETVGAVSFNFTVAQTPALNNGAWRHIAIVYDGTNRKIYTDGTLQNTTAFTTTRSYTTLYIGERSDSPGNTYQGYMQDFRIYKGIAKYTGNFTLPSYSPSTAAGNDSLVDVPSSSGTDTGVGGEVRGNYCTWNPLDTSGGTLTDGNLQLATGTATYGGTRGTISVSTGKWYWEVTPTAMSTSGELVAIGICASTVALPSFAGSGSLNYTYMNDGQKRVPGSDTNYGATFTTNDVIGVALDLDAGTLVFYKNGSSQGTAFSSLSGTFAPYASDADAAQSCTLVANWGARPFAYTAPSGFKALCTANLPAPLITKPNTVMDVALYTGNGSTQTISGLGFSPDLVWVKMRNSTEWHTLTDAVRGDQKSLFTNATNAEDTGRGISLLSSGFSVDSWAAVNYNTGTYVAWTWDAGSSTVTNTQGSITSSVRANATAGFSIVTYTGTGANATVGHGLGVAPSMVIVKKRSATGAWVIGFTFSGFNWASDYFQFDTGAKRTDGAGTVFTTSPSSTVFSLGTESGVNGSSATFVAYCFAPVVGYSSFGSYTGNGSADGPFVYTGFRPRWVMVKQSSASGEGWWIRDAARNTYNSVESMLAANSSGAEISSSGYAIDFLSNGFKLRNSNPDANASGATYVYAAFAESPFNYARAR